MILPTRRIKESVIIKAENILQQAAKPHPRYFLKVISNDFDNDAKICPIKSGNHTHARALRRIAKVVGDTRIFEILQNGSFAGSVSKSRSLYGVQRWPAGIAGLGASAFFSLKKKHLILAPPQSKYFSQNKNFSGRTKR